MFAEHLSARLLVLQRVFLVGRVWPQLPSHIGMQLKEWLVHKHPFHYFRNVKLQCEVRDNIDEYEGAAAAKQRTTISSRSVRCWKSRSVP